MQIIICCQQPQIFRKWHFFPEIWLSEAILKIRNIVLGPKHISELSEFTEGAYRIGFKLEVDSSEDDLIKRSLEQISRYGVDAVIANNLNDLKDRNSPRCRIVMPDGNFSVILDQISMCEAIESLVSLHDP